MSSMIQMNNLNDASLEHCFTNIFALTDFSGIQYIKYVLKIEKVYSNAFDDPIIKSYALCQKHSVMSAWVRSKPDISQPLDPCSFSMFPRELWVFWYGNTSFPHFKTCILPELREEDHGNWRQGLSYETRTVLFRALHNVVESTQYSVSFSFFLHGESTVCASLDIRQNPVVQAIGAELVQQCSQTQTTVPVILAPYGISAELVRFAYEKKSENELAFEIDSWSTLYPLRTSSEFEMGLNAGNGLPFFVMATPTNQNTRQQNRFPNEKKRSVDVVQHRSKDSVPKFVEVIINGFRIRYPICFVLIDVENDLVGISNKSNPTNNTTSLTTDTSANQSNPHIFESCVPDKYTTSLTNPMLGNKPSKFSINWKSRKQNISSSSKAMQSIALGTELMITNSFLHSDFLRDCKFIYLAGRTLKRIFQNNYRPINPNRNFDWQSKKSFISTKEVPSASDENLIIPISNVYSLGLQDPCLNTECRCNRFSYPRSRRPANFNLFHQQDFCVRQSLKNSIKDPIVFYDRPRTPQPCVTSSFHVAHDPSMPTLSPQQPAPLQNSTLNLNTLVSSDKCINELNKDTFSNEQNNHPNNLNANVPLPPPLVSKSEPSLLTSSVNTNLKLPIGLVSVDQSTLSSQKLIKLSTPLNGTSPSVSITKRKMLNVWLVKYANQELRREPRNGKKRQTLSLSIPDLIEKENYNFNCTRSYNQSNIRLGSPMDSNSYMGEDLNNSKNINEVNDDSFLRTKRLRTIGTVQHDVYDYNHQGENGSFPNNEMLANNYTLIDPLMSDSKVAISELDLPDDEQHQHNLLLNGYSTSSGNTYGSRTVGLISRRGVSLASSSGSGPIGPAELALMLPTPPSHDAPQPSPVDGVSIIPIRVGIPTTNPVFTGSPLNQMMIDSICPKSPASDMSFCFANSIDSPQSLFQTQGLCNLAKSPWVVQNHVDQTAESQQDWIFAQPCAAYLGMSSNYQMPQDGIFRFSHSLPQLKWSYDHRVLNTKPITISTDNQLSSNESGFAIKTTTAQTLLKSSFTSSVSIPSTISSTTSITQKPFSGTDIKFYSPQHAHEFDTSGVTKLSESSMRPSNHCEMDLSEQLTSMYEVDGLLVNLILSDSMLNLFKDHNFDSCNICECTSSILGSEIGVYLSNPNHPSSPVCINKSLRSNSTNFGASDLVTGSGFNFNRSCKCGFSAVMNQKYVVNGNLFYEDEIEVTRLSVQSNKFCIDNVYSSMPTFQKNRFGWWVNAMKPSASHLLLLQQYACSIFEEFCVRQVTDLLRYTKLSQDHFVKENRLEYDDTCALIDSAIRNAVKYDFRVKSDDENFVKNQSIGNHNINTTTTNTTTTTTNNNNNNCSYSIHPSFLLKAGSKIPENQNDQIRLLATMRPWLQEAISSTRLLESNYTVDGPLTWKDFHQLAGRGSDETCKPQPIPQLRVSSDDQENLLISPFAIRDWDRLALFPLSRQKRIAYAVILPSESDSALGDQWPSKTSSGLHSSQLHRNSLFANLNTDFGSSNDNLAPTSNFMTRSVSNFFRELSHTYENCHLGQHFPYHQPEIDSPETAFIPIFPQTESLSFSQSDPSGGGGIVTPPSSDVFKSLIDEMRTQSICPDSVLNLIHTYVTASIRSALAAFRKNGITFETCLKNGSQNNSSSSGIATTTTNNNNSISTSTIFPPFDCAKMDKSDQNLMNKIDGPDMKFNMLNNNNNNNKRINILGKSDGNYSTSPNNGQGPMTTSLDTSFWGSMEDVYLVIYILNPFTYFCDLSPELARLVVQALVGCAHQILTSLPESWQPRVTTHLLSLDHVMSDYLPRLRPIALALYSSVNRIIKPSLINANRTLTGFGPASEKETTSREKEHLHKRLIFAPPYTLIGSRDLWGQWELPVSEPLDRSSVLFVAYCLSQDQRWLMATFTDEQGGLSDQTLINIQVPKKFFSEPESQRTLSPRRIGLARLWDYIINLVSQTSNPWRLVVGRIGRLGHGELKGWNGILGRKSLQDVNKFFRERCLACHTSACILSTSILNASLSGSGGTKPMLNLINSSSGANSCTHELPSLISACLVSLEPQSTFRIYPGFGLCSDEPWNHCGGGGGGTGGGGAGGAGGSGSNSNLSAGMSGAFHGASASPLAMRMMSMLSSSSSTDIPSATHILVFPTSTSASGVSEHDPSGLADVIYGIGSDDMNVFDWLLPNDAGLDDFVAPAGTAADMLDALDHSSALGFGLSGLESSVCGNGSNNRDASVALLVGHDDYVNDFHDHRGHHSRVSDGVVGLHNIDPGVMNLGSDVGGGGTNELNSQCSFGTGRLDEQDRTNHLLNTMPFGIHDPTDEVGSLMQQPLAMGYYISTAPTGPLPSWFWVACPHAKHQYPVCLKAALHFQTSLICVDDAAAAAAAAAPPPNTGGSNGGVPSTYRPNHLLDSTSTCDVLRFVLEAYNALSWLSIDPTTNDRRTCLPIHMLSLAQIYQAFEAFT